MAHESIRKSLSRLETLQSTPPFFQLHFLLRLILLENCLKSFKMLGKAFCGNGFIHLNIAEIHEENIGGQKKCAYSGDRGSKREYLGVYGVRGMKKVKAFRFEEWNPIRP